ncbi:MAG: small multi-drug export protein [Clostridiales Family XIII bacterium]|nr:small multi-drug export protein [Clostridiales Family XIII bacterium]
MAHSALIAFLMSMLPVVELRGGLIFASASGVPFWEAFIICCAGNILPVPFILFFLRRIFSLLEKNRHTAKLISWLEDKAKKAERRIGKYELLGLFLLVAVPLPGTGAWTGSLVAVIFDMRVKRAFPAIAAGVVAAGVIMSVVSYFIIPGMFF